MLRRVRDIDASRLGELRGAKVYGPDQEKLGSVDDALIDDRTLDLRYLLVDSGFLRSRWFVVPADQVYASGSDNDLYVNLRQADVEALPEFREEALASDEAFARYESDYHRAWQYDADPARVRPSPVLERFRQRVRSGFAREQATTRPGVMPATYVASGRARPVAVYGVYLDRKNVERAVDQLREAGFSNNDISVIFPERDLTKEFALEKATKAPEGALAGGGTGLVIGGALGWLAGIGTLAIPGIGPLIAAGPIVAVIAGAGVGSAIGGIAGALIGLGVPEIEARRYEEEIKSGRILVSIHCENLRKAQAGRKLLQNSGAKDVFLSGEQQAA